MVVRLAIGRKMGGGAVLLSNAMLGLVLIRLAIGSVMGLKVFELAMGRIIWMVRLSTENMKMRWLCYPWGG